MHGQRLLSAWDAALAATLARQATGVQPRIVGQVVGQPGQEIS